MYERLTKWHEWKLADSEADQARRVWVAALGSSEGDAERLFSELKTKVRQAHDLFSAAMSELEGLAAAHNHRDTRALPPRRRPGG